MRLSLKGSKHHPMVGHETGGAEQRILGRRSGRCLLARKGCGWILCLASSEVTHVLICHCDLLILVKFETLIAQLGQRYILARAGQLDAH